MSVTAWRARSTALTAAATNALLRAGVNSLEAIRLRRSLEAQHAEQVRQAAEVEELRSASRRRARDAERGAERAGEHVPIR